jgi:succinate dehydrogenase/fumarate reductase flavoprotein subunit
VALEWPYPIKYGEETEVNADVLIVGGGLAGSFAAISAAKKGAKVVVVEKAATIRSGSAGAGLDHWGGALTNPCSTITPEEMFDQRRVGGPGRRRRNGYRANHVMYIMMKENWDALLELEKMGLQFRDVDNEFVGAPFRDDETKIMFAYDLTTKTTIRLRSGVKLKPILHKEQKKLGVNIYDRVMATSLLTEGGNQGARIVGATGVNVRTGEFYVFKGKATILSTGQPLRMWVFSTELVGSNAEHDDPNCAGDGCAMAWKAGADLALMERSAPSGGAFRYPAYGVGGGGDTWYPCTLVDANGKEVPFVDREGKVLTTVAERYRGRARVTPDLPDLIRKGEFVLPLYADLPSMPAHERRAIFGLMVGNEGKTRIIYNMYTKAGFDPDQDMLQAPVFPPDGYRSGDYFQARGVAPPQWRTGGSPAWGGGGVVVDWDLKTSLDGLYAAGVQIAGASGGAAAGRYAGRKAAKYALETGDPVIEKRQVDAEKARVYAPVKRKEGIGWKELHAGICRIMQNYCGEYKNEETLKLGLWWLNSIRESESARAYARNPHELMRTLECFVRLTVGEIIMHTSLGRKASSRSLDFKRLDYPEMDPPEWNKYITVHLEKGNVKVGELPFNYWLQSPNAPTYEENYKEHANL